MVKAVFAAVVAGVLASAPPAFADAANGEAIFYDKVNAKCIGCHTFARKVIGPSLKDIRNRHSKEWIIGWLVDPVGAWSGNDPETLDLRKRVKKEGLEMPTHFTPKISPKQAEDLADFLFTK